MEQRNPLWMRQYLVKDRGDPILILKEKQGHNNLSLETMNRIRIVSGIKIVRKQGEWSSAKKTETNFKCYRRRSRNILWFVGMFMSVTMESAVFMRKKLPEQLSIHREHNRSHTQTNVRHIYEDWCLSKMRSQVWRQLVGKIIHGNSCLWLVMKELSIFNAQKSTSFQILYCVLVRFSKNPSPSQTLHGNKDWSGSKLHRNTETWTELTASQWNLEWNIFPGFNTLQLFGKKAKIYCCRLGWDTRELSQEEFYVHVDVQRHFLWNEETMNKNVWQTLESRMANARVVKVLAKRFGKRTMVIHWSWFWKAMVLYRWRQSTRRSGTTRRKGC